MYLWPSDCSSTATLGPLSWVAERETILMGRTQKTVEIRVTASDLHVENGMGLVRELERYLDSLRLAVQRNVSPKVRPLYDKVTFRVVSYRTWGHS